MRHTATPLQAVRSHVHATLSQRKKTAQNVPSLITHHSTRTSGRPIAKHFSKPTHTKKRRVSRDRRRIKWNYHHQFSTYLHISARPTNKTGRGGWKWSRVSVRA